MALLFVFCDDNCSFIVQQASEDSWKIRRNDPAFSFLYGNNSCNSIFNLASFSSAFRGLSHDAICCDWNNCFLLLQTETSIKLGSNYDLFWVLNLKKIANRRFFGAIPKDFYKFATAIIKNNYHWLCDPIAQFTLEKIIINKKLEDLWRLT